MHLSAQHEQWMGLALEQARRTLGQDRPSAQDVPIGAVVVDAHGRVIGSGHNERELTGDPTAHAEVLAIRRAAETLGSWRLDGCTLAVTLEPCPMCAGAILLARIPTLVMGAWDPKAGAVGSVFDLLRDRRMNHWVEVFPEVREQECGHLLREFFHGHRRRGG